LGALSRAESRHPLLPALAAQGFGIVAVGLPTLVFFPSLLQQAMLLAMLQGGIAAIMARALQAPSWWLVIHIVFMPLVVGVRALDLPAWTWPTGLILLLLVFWRTDRGQVPLYLSSRECVESVLPLLPSRPCRVIDLGCGDGALLRRLARARPDSRFVGVEHAPLPWLWSRLAGSSLPNLNDCLGQLLEPSPGWLRSGLCLSFAGADVAAVGQGHGRDEPRRAAGQQQLRRSRADGGLANRGKRQGNDVFLRISAGGHGGLE
jgi:hypothetical protein